MASHSQSGKSDYLTATATESERGTPAPSLSFVSELDGSTGGGTESGSVEEPIEQIEVQVTLEPAFKPPF